MRLSSSSILTEGGVVGQWTILAQAPSHKKPSGSVVSMWECQCACGLVRNVRGDTLRSGNSLSCGCSNKKAPSGSDSTLWKGYGEITGAKWDSIKRGALRKTKKLDFNLSIKDAWNLFLRQDRRCALSGQRLLFHSSELAKTSKNEFDIVIGPKNNGNASLDRIDSDYGYTLDNVQWIHKDINKMKMDLDEQKFIMYCKLIASHRV